MRLERELLKQFTEQMKKNYEKNIRNN